MNILFLLCLAAGFAFMHAETIFRINSKQFQLSRQQQLPDTYGPPKPQPHPDDTDGFTTEAIQTSTDNEAEVIEAARARKLNEKIRIGDKLTGDDASKGVYYIYHPTGLLQKVSYSSKDDAGNMAFSTRLKYENVEPINGPVYTYDPKTYVFKRLQ